MSMQLPTRPESCLSVRKILPDARGIGTTDLGFASCSGSWEDCRTGDLFVAIDTGSGDGHEHAQQAVDRGAVGIVTERLLAVDVPQFLVDDSRQAFGLVCHALAGFPAQRLTTIVVAGSDGKTVTSHLIESIFRNAGFSTGLSGSMDGSSIESSGSGLSTTDPCPAGLAGWLNSQVGMQREIAIVEASRTALAHHAMAGATFDAGIITNVRPDNSRQHGTSLNYQRVLQRMLTQLKPGGIAVINVDDPRSAQMLADVSVPLLTIGIRQQADVTAQIIESDRCGQTICINAGNDSAIVQIPTIGRQQIYNCLAAVAVGLSQNIDLAQIARGIELASQIPGRMERIECGQPFAVWIDSAQSPSQLATAVHAVRQVTTGRVLVAVTIQPGQNKAQRKRIGEIIQRRMDHVVITQPDCQMISDYEPAHQILDGIDSHDQVRLIPNRMDAVEWLLAEARPGDAVLVSGVGEKPIASLAEEKWTVTDKDLVQAWLYDNRAGFSPAVARRAQIYRMKDYLQ